jgi:hypothetical protein
VAQIADNSLEARIKALEEAVGSLLATRAVGGTTVAATNPAAVTLTGTASTAGSVAWDTTSGPSADLYVSAGRLLVQVAASFEVYGNKCSMFAGYQVRGPVTVPTDPTTGADLLTTAPVAVTPSNEKAAQLQDDGTGMNQLGAFSTFDLVTGLGTGWYRVTEAYALTYAGTTDAPYGIATYRRLAVTRY